MFVFVLSLLHLQWVVDHAHLGQPPATLGNYTNLSSANLMLDGTTVACGQCSPVFSQSCATTVACGQCSPSGLWIMLTCLQSVLYSYSGLWTMLPCLQSVLCSHSGLWTMLTCLQSVLCSYSGLWTMLTCLQSILYNYSSPLHPQSCYTKIYFCKWIVVELFLCFFPKAIAVSIMPMKSAANNWIHWQTFLTTRPISMDLLSKISLPSFPANTTVCMMTCNLLLCGNWGRSLSGTRSPTHMFWDQASPVKMVKSKDA